MATSSRDRQLEELKAENARLHAELEELKAVAKVTDSDKRPAERGGRFFKRLGSIFLIGLAAALLVVGNLVFWTANTIVKPDRFVAATEPIIQDPAVQTALATRIGDRIFDNVDIEQVLTEALPPRAEFVAPSIASQVENYTRSTVKKIIERPQFQERWNQVLGKAHARFIGSAERNGSDGSIDISEVYQDASQQLKGTKLGFLADKPLPARVGNVELVSGGWLVALQRTIQNIDTWRVVTLILFAVSCIGGIWLARNRRKAVVALGIMLALVMFITAISIRLARELAAGKVEPQFAEAVRNAYSIFFHGLAVQTFTILAAALVIAFIAWISGNWRSSQAVRLKINQLLSGKIHTAIFSKGENGLTRWFGKYRRVLEWLAIGLVAASMIFVRLTPQVLITQVVIIIVFVVIVEILAAKPESDAKRPAKP